MKVKRGFCSVCKTRFIGGAPVENPVLAKVCDRCGAICYAVADGVTIFSAVATGTLIALAICKVMGW